MLFLHSSHIDFPEYKDTTQLGLALPPVRRCLNYKSKVNPVLFPTCQFHLDFSCFKDALSLDYSSLLTQERSGFYTFSPLESRRLASLYIISKFNVHVVHTYNDHKMWWIKLQINELFFRNISKFSTITFLIYFILATSHLAFFLVVPHLHVFLYNIPMKWILTFFSWDTQMQITFLICLILANSHLAFFSSPTFTCVFVQHPNKMNFDVFHTRYTNALQ